MQKITVTGLIFIIMVLLFETCTTGMGYKDDDIIFKSDFISKIGSKPKGLKLTEGKDNVSIVEDSIEGNWVLFLDDQGEKSINIDGDFPRQTGSITVFIVFM